MNRFAYRCGDWSCGECTECSKFKIGHLQREIERLESCIISAVEAECFEESYNELSHVYDEIKGKENDEA